MDEAKRRPITTLSLFSGAGGLDVGFHRAGYAIVGCVEIDQNYCKTLEANKGAGKTFGVETEIICEDVRKFDATKFRRQGIDCIIGGPPCQTFSAAGRRSGGVLGTSDARGRLFQAYCEILDTLKPSVFVFENVYGLPGANNGGPWREIVAAFQSHGYELKADVLDAADYGVPQHRERLIMVGFRSGRFEFPLPTHGPDSPTSMPLRTVAEAITDLQEPGEQERDDLGGLYGHLLPLVPPGLNYAFFTREMGYPEPIFAWRSKFHDFLYKVDPASPCRTVKAKPGKFTGPFHWHNRHFTPAELKRLQSFPDEYAIMGNYGRIVEQIGNSVPPLLAHVIAASVREQLVDRTPDLTFPCRPPGFKSTFRQRQRERTHHFRHVAKKVIDERFKRPRLTQQSLRKRKPQTTYSVYEGFFRKRSLAAPPAKCAAMGRVYSSVAEFEGDCIALAFVRLHGGKWRRRIKIDITGLHEGLTSIRQLIANAEVSALDDIFYLWDAIQEVLVKNTKFLTLIDIYGHYANRGDTVRISTDIIGGQATTLFRAIRFFGDSANCGEAVPRAAIKSNLGVNDAELESLITEMRSMRFDIRTQRTHPTIARGTVLCTYPFPLLSDKAHLDRRLKVLSLEQERAEELTMSESLFD